MRIVDTALERWNALAPDSLYRRHAMAFFWSLAGSAASQGCYLVASIIAGRLLGREGFGEFGIINSTIGTFGIFAGLGLGMLATKYVAELRSGDRARAGRIIGFSTLVALAWGGGFAILLASFSPSLAARILNAAHLAPELRVSGLLLLVNAVNGALTGALLGLEGFRSAAIMNATIGLCLIPFTFTGVRMWGLLGAVWASVAANAGGTVAGRILLAGECRRAGIGVRYSVRSEECRLLWTFSLPAVMSSAMVAPMNWITNTILVNQPNGYAEMGLFTAANQWRNAIVFLPGVLAQVALPILSSVYGHGRELKRYQQTLRLNLAVTVACAFAVSVPVCLLAPAIMRFYGRSFAGGSTVLAMLAIVALLMAANNVIGSAIISSGAIWYGLLFNALWAGALLLLATILVPRYLALGVAGALLLAYLGHTVWQSVYLAFALRKSAAAVPDARFAAEGVAE